MDKLLLVNVSNCSDGNLGTKLFAILGSVFYILNMKFWALLDCFRYTYNDTVFFRKNCLVDLPAVVQMCQHIRHFERVCWWFIYMYYLRLCFVTFKKEVKHNYDSWQLYANSNVAIFFIHKIGAILPKTKIIKLKFLYLTTSK